MNRQSTSEKLLIEEVTQASSKLRNALRGLSIGRLIKTIRVHLGMSQKALALRAKIPQSTVSRIESGSTDANLSTLNKILSAMSCDIAIAPVLLEPIDSIRSKQAKKIATRRLQYLKGTMNLEDQQPDPTFIQELLKQEEETLLKGPNSQLWEE